MKATDRKMVNTIMSTLSVNPESFVNCLNDIRISVVSKRLIEEPTRTVSEIAFESGFSNLSNFNRVFKKKKGMTPQEYRSIFFKRYMIV